MEFIVVHYHEVGLKGRNRSFFENKLVKNIRFALKGLSIKKVKKIFGRILVELDSSVDFSVEDILSRLQRVCGIANFSPGYSAPPEIEELSERVAEKVIHLSPSSFAVRAKRSEKSYPLTSPEINAQIGAHIVEKTGWKVNLTSPDLLIQLEVFKKKVFFYTQKISGPGGLPIGVSDPTLCLLSGGIDSPVAAYRLLKRGSPVDFIHFHSFPFTNEQSIQKVRDLAKLLARHRYSPRLYLMPFGDIQKEIVAKTSAPYRVILYRRFMARIAERLARKIGALALVTGESLGQVASQTLQNLAAIESVVEIPILRPLIGMDKQEIIRDSKALGTFDLSIEPHEDCCSFLMPQNPVTRSTPGELTGVEEPLNVEEMVEAAMEKMEEERV